MTDVHDQTAPAHRRIPFRVQAEVFLRSFAIQGSWNYRTMIGQGFAFSLLPLLRFVYGSDDEALERALQRHAHYFNAHPYLAEVALGAVARMEVEGLPPESMGRFKDAIRSPLGSLGDGLIWAGALPAAALIAVLAALAGGPVWLPAALFLVGYNLIHLSLRIWAFRTGLREGAEVAGSLAAVRLPTYAERLRIAGLFFLGAVGAFAGVRLLSMMYGLDALLAFLAVAGIAAGARLGNEAWKAASWASILVVAGILAFGGFS